MFNGFSVLAFCHHCFKSSLIGMVLLYHRPLPIQILLMLQTLNSYDRTNFEGGVGFSAPLFGYWHSAGSFLKQVAQEGT
jgi:hypothetical protein